MLTCYAVALRLLLPHRKSISFIILRSNAFVNRCFYRKKKGFFAVLKIQNHVSNPSLNYYGEDGGIFYLLSKGTPYLSPKFFRFAQNLEPRFKSLFMLFMAQMEGFSTCYRKVHRTFLLNFFALLKI